MSTNTIMIIAIVVFVLMAIGLVLTVREFRQLAEEPVSEARERRPSPR